MTYTLELLKKQEKLEKEARIIVLLEQDKKLQRQVMRGEITNEEFNKRSRVIHAEWSKLTDEEKQLAEMMGEK